MQVLRNVDREKAFETTIKIYLCTKLLLQKHLHELEASQYAYKSEIMVNRADNKSKQDIYSSNQAQYQFQPQVYKSSKCLYKNLNNKLYYFQNKSINSPMYFL